jgi:uncharacterized protein (TIGR02453 family)
MAGASTSKNGRSRLAGHSQGHAQSSNSGVGGCCDTGAMDFNGWSELALDFYEGLEADNSKTYWTAHKHIYEEHVLGPMEALAAELAPQSADVKFFRPYRDVRFSRDKSPYKTAIGAVIGDVYVQLSARGLAAGSGMYQMAADQLDRYRRAVADDIAGAELTRIVTAIRGQDIDVEGRDELKTAPRGYPADHPRIDLLRCKGLIAWRQWQPAPWLGTAEAKTRISTFATHARPLSGWLDQHVGRSELAAR